MRARPTRRETIYDFIIGVNASDIAALPTSGTGAWGQDLAVAYANVVSHANATITPNVTDISSQEGNKAVAAALVWLKTGTTSYRTKVITALDTISDPSTGWPSLPSIDHQVINRMVCGWVIAADLIGYRSANMLAFADDMRTHHQSSGSPDVDAKPYDRMVDGARYWANNHATLAKASFMACTLYLKEEMPYWVLPSVYCLWGDVTHGFGTYADTTPHQHADGYVVDSGGKTYELTWGLDYTNNGWTPINSVPGDPTRDGALVIEIPRQTSNAYINYSLVGGIPKWGADFMGVPDPGDPDPTTGGAEYFGTWLQGALVCNVFAEKHGAPGIWTAASDGVQRAWEYVFRYPSRWPTPGTWSHAFTTNRWVDSLVKQKVPALSATGFPMACAGGYGFGFTDWLMV